MDNRQDIANDVMDNREDMWNDISSPGWAWAAGAAVATLPAICTPVVCQDTTYYYSDGHYLEPCYQGDEVAYVVTAPAPGTVICGGLPAETVAQVVDGVEYQFCAGVYYAPDPQSGPDCYVVVASE